MLHTKSQGHRLSGSVEEYFLRPGMNLDRALQEMKHFISKG